MENRSMRLVYDEKRGGIVSLTSKLDGNQTEFVLTPGEFPEYDVENGNWLGSVEGIVAVDGREISFQSGDVRKNSRVLYRRGSGARESGGQCQTVQDSETKEQEEQDEILVECPEIRCGGMETGLSMEMEFTFQGEALVWNIMLKNKSQSDVLIKNLNLPLLMNQYFRNDDTFKYDRCVMRHTCIVGHSSYLYWEKSSGNSPVLLMMPLGNSMFFDLTKEGDGLFGGRFGEGLAYEGMVRVHLVGERPVYDGPGNVTCLGPGESASFQTAFVFLESEKQIPEALAAQSLTVLKAVPGMVGPIENDFYVMTQPLDAVVELCSLEDQVLDTTVKNGWKVSRIRFGACGRRYVRVINKGRDAYYCFFGTESPREMIDGHAAFIAEKHLEQDESDPCYHALLMWDMGNKRRINAAFNPYTEDWWRGGSDDPGLASGLFLSEKNVYRPVERELSVLNAFVEDFVIKRLTEQPGWRVHRMVPWFVMFEPWAGNGADDVWRAYNYIHVINIMRNMYLIKKQYQVPYFRKAVEYLKMAYEYTRAMFHYWMYPRGAGAWEFGNMGEMTLPLCLAQELQAEGLIREAEEISGIMDKKAQYFASKEYPFGSEMPYDSTAFEAVYAYGKRMGDDRVMGSAARASFANCGKQPVWFLYNTDLRGGGDTGWNSSYMTQLGACPILDYCLEEGHIDEDWVLSFYGAWLSGWLLYNSGGYWDADPENRGATGWITIASRINYSDPEPAGISDKGEKAGMPLSKGCVTLSGEAGIGYFGALRSACSIVLDHSVLGRIGLGCDTRPEKGKETIVPRDGLSMRLYHIPERWKIEAAGGFLHQVRVTADALEIDVVPRVKKGMRLQVMSIPKEGERQEVLYQSEVVGSCGESHTVRIERAALKNRREEVSR